MRQFEVERARDANRIVVQRPQRLTNCFHLRQHISLGGRRTFGDLVMEDCYSHDPSLAIRVSMSLPRYRFGLVCRSPARRVAEPTISPIN